ncbi:MAG: MFS transporter [Acidimicrobiia bacterium]|nr:MFS transporter [Acidimicrobiia bacterium]
MTDPRADTSGQSEEPAGTGAIRFASAPGRRLLFATVLGSGVVAMDASVVNVALPTIGADLDAGVAGLQWILVGYLLSLSSLILLGGALGDRFGRRRIFLYGVVWFAAASLLCGVAPTIEVLIVARILQGIGGALLTPGSLAIIQTSFHPDDRGRAVGAWSGLGGIATAIGPLVGGWLVDVADWRWVFLVNLPLAVVTVVVASRHVPESIDPTVLGQPIDLVGSALIAVGLGATTYSLIRLPEAGLGSGTVLVSGMLGVAALVGFVLVEQRSTHPMLPLDIFASRQFTGANLVTVAVYAGLGGFFFLLVVQLQTSLGYSALRAGAATLPLTLVMLALSSRFGALAARIGPRLPMTAGPIVIAVAMVMMTRIGPGAGYVTVVLPAILVFSLGLAATVAPLTATVLGAADDHHAGIASGTNNAVARVAQLSAIALLPGLAGIEGDDFQDAVAFTDGFRVAAMITAGLAVVGAAIAWITIRRPLDSFTDEVRPAAAHCSLSGPPLRLAEPHGRAPD